MHEEALLKDVIRKAEEVARRPGTGRVTGIHLWVGARCHLVGPELEARVAHVVGENPLLAGARVKIEVSRDPNDPKAESVVLRSIDVEPAPGSR